MWTKIPILDLEITLKALDEIKLPFFRENALRVGLGTTFRNTVCINTSYAACDGCRLESLCSYNRIFNAVTYPYISFFEHDTPYIIKPETQFKLNLRLFGPAVTLYPYFYFGLENLGNKGIGLRNSNGQRGRFFLNQINTITPEGKRELVYNKEAGGWKKEIISFTLGKYVAPRPVQYLSLKTLSPLRLKYQGHLNNSLEFHVLLRAALRRISKLYYLETGACLELDYQRLILAAMNVIKVESNLRWFDYKRYSTVQHQEMKLGGLIGEVAYKGEMTELYPFVKAGEILGIGKGLSFGFGRFITKGVS